MTHPARHSRPKDRQQVAQHALGDLLEDVGSRAPAGHRRKEHAEQQAEHAQRAAHAQQQQQPETTAPPMSLRQNGAYASPNRSALQMARPLDAPAICCGRTSDVLHEAYGMGTALGGALPCDAATCRDSSSYIDAVRVWRKAEDEQTVVQAPASACTAAEPHPPHCPPHMRVQETVSILLSQVLDVSDAENLKLIMQQLQMAQNIVVQKFCNAGRSSAPAPDR